MMREKKNGPSVRNWLLAGYNMDFNKIGDRMREGMNHILYYNIYIYIYIYELIVRLTKYDIGITYTPSSSNICHFNILHQF
jgi:hypothetical protein